MASVWLLGVPVGTEMPIECKGGEKPRYRVMEQGGKKYRVAFCGDRMVERTLLKKNKAGKLKKSAKSKKIG